MQLGEFMKAAQKGMRMELSELSDSKETREQREAMIDHAVRNLGSVAISASTHETSSSDLSDARATEPSSVASDVAPGYAEPGNPGGIW